MRIAQALAVLACVPLLTAAAKEPLVLAPTSAWVLNYADESCQLLRTFGDGENEATLIFERASPRSGMTMRVIGKPFDAPDSTTDFVAMFRPHDNVKAMGGEAARSIATKQPAVLWTHAGFRPWSDEDILTFETGRSRKMSLKEAKALAAALKKAEKETDDDAPIDVEKRRAERAEALAAASKVKTIDISRSGGRLVTLRTGSMGQVDKAMDQCANQLMASWGVDPNVEEAIAYPVRAPNFTSWFDSDDYPEDMLRAGQQSFLNILVLISAQGKVTKCTTVSPIKGKSFETKVCEVMKNRAKFRPAKLADGTAVPSYYVQNIQFRMPR